MFPQAIVATTQQSRFHKETLETIAEDVDLKTLNLTVGDNELLVDANLRLFAGVHYGLVGANGVGKCGPHLLPAKTISTCSYSFWAPKLPICDVSAIIHSKGCPV